MLVILVDDDSLTVLDHKCRDEMRLMAMLMMVMRDDDDTDISLFFHSMSACRDGRACVSMSASLSLTFPRGRPFLPRSSLSSKVGRCRRFRKIEKRSKLLQSDHLIRVIYIYTLTPTTVNRITWPI